MKASQVTKQSVPPSARSNGRAAVARVAATSRARAPKPNGAASAAVPDKKLQARTTAAGGSAKPAARKVKMVRDRIAVPKPEYALLAEMKARAGRLAAPVKKNKLIRAGIQALAALSDAAFLGTLHALPHCKAKRASKSK